MRKRNERKERADKDLPFLEKRKIFSCEEKITTAKRKTIKQRLVKEKRFVIR